MTRDDGYTRYTIRIPTPLYERVKAAAGEASVNSLVVATLEEAYPPPEQFHAIEFITSEWTSQARDLSDAEQRDLADKINSRLADEGESVRVRTEGGGSLTFIFPHLAP